MSLPTETGSGRAWSDCLRRAVLGRVRFPLVDRRLALRELGSNPSDGPLDNSPAVTHGETNGPGGPPVKRASVIWPRGNHSSHPRAAGGSSPPGGLGRGPLSSAVERARVALFLMGVA